MALTHGVSPSPTARTTGLRSPVTRWVLKRLRASDQLELNHRNLYILPTRAGLMLGLTLLVLLIGSINYQLNLGYLLTFLLLGCAVVGLHVCHGNLRGLRLKLTPPEPGFCGQTIPLVVTLDNPSRHPRCGVALGQAGRDDWVWADVPREGSETLVLGWTGPRRGRLTLPLWQVHSLFPLGTFRTWSYWRPAATVLVYPAPESHAPPLPPGEPRAGGGATRHATASGEFEGVRAYRRGDSLKTVVWKKAAQHWAAGRDELVSRDEAAHQPTDELWLDWQHTGLTDVEARCARLCAWVLAAERLGVAYGLRLPGQQIAPDIGLLHQRRCLEALALC